MENPIGITADNALEILKILAMAVKSDQQKIIYAILNKDIESAQQLIPALLQEFIGILNATDRSSSDLKDILEILSSECAEFLSICIINGLNTIIS
jgi:hypothetical protein